MYRYILTLFILCSKSVAQENSASLVISSDYFTEKDTLELYVYTDLIGGELVAPPTVLRAIPQNGKATFTIESEASVVASLSFSYQKRNGIPTYGIFNLVRLYPADRIALELEPAMGRHVQTSGYDNGERMFEKNWRLHVDPAHGGYRMKAELEMEDFMKERYTDFSLDSSIVDYGVNNYLIGQEALWLACHLKMDRYRSEISALEFEHLEADLYGKLQHTTTLLLTRVIAIMRNRPLQLHMVKITDTLLREAQRIQNSPVLRQSPHYSGYLADIAFLNVKCKMGRSDLDSTVQMIQQTFDADPHLRDLVLTDIMLKRFVYTPDDGLLDSVLEVIGDLNLIERLAKLKTITKGNALNFTLPDATGKQYSLSDFKGKFILVDFWYSSCAPCRSYIENVIRPFLQDEKSSHHVQVIMVSIDRKEVFSRAIDILPKVVVALYTEGKRSKHPLIQRLGIRSYPYPILIDREGKIMASGTVLKSLTRLKAMIEKEGSP